MTAAPQTRVGWCPGALRPMPSRDGLIVRVKPRSGALSPVQAIGIAAAAREFGNGALDLTSHANLQIRGASEAALGGLTAALGGLGLLDPNVGAETRRNVMTSPLAGLDPEALLDIRPIVAALENRLVADVGLAGLPGKFCFAVSDGGRLPLGDIGADVTFDAGCRSRGGNSQSREGEAGRTAGFRVRLAGDAGTAAFCPAQSVPELAARLAAWFIAARAADPDLRRMRQSVARIGAAAILAAVGLRAEAWPAPSAHPQPSWPGFSRPPMPGNGSRRGEEGWSSAVGHFSLASGVDGPDEPGRNDLGEGRVRDGFGVAAAFGRLDAAQLDVLARGALRAGASELRLTPWRAILVPGLTRSAAEQLAEDSAAVGLITDPGDPRLRVAACVGAPGCHRGTTPVLDHAARWAGLLRPGPRDRGILLHVSGCAKGCAHPAMAPVTLVAEDGRYRLVTRGIPGPAGLDAAAVERILDAACEDRPT